MGLANEISKLADQVGMRIVDCLILGRIDKVLFYRWRAGHSRPFSADLTKLQDLKTHLISIKSLHRKFQSTHLKKEFS
jgi:hypothetical protein